jgi:hypothetical protein
VKWGERQGGREIMRDGEEEGNRGVRKRRRDLIA